LVDAVAADAFLPFLAILLEQCGLLGRQRFRGVGAY
jgi:hypothetical protein